MKKPYYPKGSPLSKEMWDRLRQVREMLIGIEQTFAAYQDEVEKHTKKERKP